MILQALCDYYERKQQQGKGDLPAQGFEEREIPFVIVINEAGAFVQLEDTRTPGKNKKLIGRTFRVPKASGRSGAKSYETAYLLWDHYGYLLAQPKPDDLNDAEKAAKAEAMAQNQHQTFCNRVIQLESETDSDTGVRAVRLFLANPAAITAVKEADNWNECLKIKGCNLSFRLAGDFELICQRAAVIKWVEAQNQADSDSVHGICLIRGAESPLARLHPAISGVAQKPAPLAAINDSAYNSYGKDKGFNFPVSTTASFQYTTALNYLLSRDSANKFRLGDTTYLFWSEKQTPLENTFAAIFGYSDNPDSGTEAVKSLFQTIHNGAYTAADGKDRFYLLALAPNSARIMVRLWQNGTVAQFAENLAQWFNDLDIVGRDHYGYPPLIRLLRATALKGEDKHLSPRLPADLLRAILLNAPLPVSLIQALLNRIKAETGEVTYYRAAAIKAWLNRQNRYNANFKEVTVSLNPDETRPGYLLGRLFALLEKLQQDANRNLNATIRDRYYSSASTTPQSVFATLMRLHTHHLKKIENPKWRGAMEKRIGEVMEKIQQFPSHLNLENQGLFAIGYYHQRQHLFTKNTTSKESQHESE